MEVTVPSSHDPEWGSDRCTLVSTFFVTWAMFESEVSRPPRHTCLNTWSLAGGTYCLGRLWEFLEVDP